MLRSTRYALKAKQEELDALKKLAAEFLRELEHPVPDFSYRGHLHEELSKKVGRS